MQSAKAFALCDSEKQPMRASYHPVRDFSHFAFSSQRGDVDTAQYAKLKAQGGRASLHVHNICQLHH